MYFYDSADEVLLKPSGAQLTVEFLEEHSFSVPVMVLRRDGLGMTLPPSSFGVSDVEHYIGKVLTPFDLNLCSYCRLLLSFEFFGLILKMFFSDLFYLSQM